MRFHRERDNDSVIMVFLRKEMLLIILPIGDAPEEGCSAEIVIARRNHFSLETVFKTSGRNNF